MFVVLALCLAVALAGMVVINAGAAPATQEEEYSAYEDPEKPVLSYLLSDPKIVEEFQTEFGLDDREVEAVLAATRAENAALSKTYAESEAIVESRSFSPVEKRAKIARSGYDEEVRAAVGKTKQRVEQELPEGERADLKAWVDEHWQREVEEFNAQTAGTTSTDRAAASRGLTFKVFATQYWGYTNYEMALPHRKLKFDGGYRAVVSFNGQTARVPVKEVGPWNTYDNWWDPLRKRTMWTDLRRGIPEAQAAYYSNYNEGRDEFGRKVLNPAGADLTPAAAAQIGLKRYQNAWISVRMPWLKR